MQCPGSNQRIWLSMRFIVIDNVRYNLPVFRFESYLMHQISAWTIHLLLAGDIISLAVSDVIVQLIKFLWIGDGDRMSIIFPLSESLMIIWIGKFTR